MFRSDFPIFENNPSLVFLDSASSAQKPRSVIDALSRYFATSYANIHRGAYDLSMESSLLYETAKSAVANKLSARADEIVFTYNATYAFNLLSRGLVKSGFLQKGDIVLLSKVEHHANIVPWQILAEEYGIVIDWVELHADGTIDYDSLAEKLPNAKVLSITGASNVTGEVLDLERMAKIFSECEFRHREVGTKGAEPVPSLSRESNLGKEKGIPNSDWIASQARNDAPIRPIFILDGSQRFPHMTTDVGQYGIDFFVGTGHKVMSDTGIGFFYGRKDFLREIEPAFCGGGAINSVTTDGYEAAGLPFRHEPGTPHIAGAVSLLAALDYIDSIGGFEAVETYERELTEYALKRFEECGFCHREEGNETEGRGDPGTELLPLKRIQGRNDGNKSKIRLIGSKTPEHRLGVFSFVFADSHPNDVAEALADTGISVRAGHHCTDPLHQSLGIRGSLRASLYIYNTREDIDRLVEGLRKI